MAKRTLRASFEERFWHKVDKGDGAGCWLWVAAKLSFGYGVFGANADKAHRISYRFAFGEIPRGFCVLHRCDNPSCVRPDHLFLGTNADNTADMIAKGRARKATGDRHRSRTRPETVRRGDRHHGAKLTASDVISIRAEHASGTNQMALGRKYGVSDSTIADAVKRRTWTHIKETE